MSGEGGSSAQRIELFRRVGFAGAGALLGLLVGYAGGASKAPQKVIERHEVRVEAKTYEEELRRAEATVLELRQQMADLKTRTHRTVVTVRKPDGTVTRQRTEDIAVDQTSSSKQETVASATTQVQQVKAAESEQQAKSSRVEEAKDSWHIGVRVGTAIGQVRLAPLEVPVTWGAQVERRVYSTPVWLGAYGTTDGSVGLAVSLSF